MSLGRVYCTEDVARLGFRAVVLWRVRGNRHLVMKVIATNSGQDSIDASTDVVLCQLSVLLARVGFRAVALLRVRVNRYLVMTCKTNGYDISVGMQNYDISFGYDCIPHEKPAGSCKVGN